MTLRLDRGDTGARRIKRFFVFSVSQWFSPRILLWLPALLFLGAFFFHPLTRIFALTLDLDTLTSRNLQLAARVLGFTLYQAVLSTALTLGLGLPSAFLFTRFNFRGKSFLRALTAVPFMLPTVVVAGGFNALLGPRGWIEFPFTGTLTAILTAHVFYNTTIVIRIVSNALAGLDPRLDQAARSLGADSPRLWWHVTLPLILPSVLAAVLLVFLFDFTSFGVILLLGGPQFATLEVEIYVQALKRLNLPLASLLALVQLLCTLVFSIVYSRVMARLAVQTAPRSYVDRPARKWHERIFVAALCSLLLMFFALPLLALPVRSVSRLEADRGQRGEVQYGLTGDYYKELFVNRRGSVFYVPPAKALINSLSYAALTILFSLTLGYPAAFALAKPARFEKIIDPLLILPLSASSVTLGLGFILVYPRLLASPILVPLAHTMIALPFVIRALQPALASIPERLRQAAASLGASPLRVWLNVDWPILRRATLAAATFAFTVSLGDFGAAVVLSRPEYPTIPVAIYRFLGQPGGLNYGQAMAMATILMAVTMAGILIIERLRLPGAGEL
jgi:thiamine transport system permease protein